MASQRICLRLCEIPGDCSRIAAETHAGLDEKGFGQEEEPLGQVSRRNQGTRLARDMSGGTTGLASGGRLQESREPARPTSSTMRLVIHLEMLLLELEGRRVLIENLEDLSLVSR